MEWFLVISLYSCSAAGGPVVECGSHGYSIAVPSKEVCEQVRSFNPGASCWMRVGDTFNDRFYYDAK